MTSRDPKSYNHPDRRTLTEADVGQLGQALLSLTREVWVLSDRLAVTEAVLARHGLDLTAEINSFQPDAEMQAQLDARGARMVANVVNALAGIADVEAEPA